jgi:ABC-type transport system involved in cytochrome c biogenesis permease subunit
MMPSILQGVLMPISFGSLFCLMLLYWGQAALFSYTKYSKLTTVLFSFSFISLTTLIILRWVDSGHFPLSNLYESLLFLSWSFLGIQLVAQLTLLTALDNRPSVGNFAGAVSEPALLGCSELDKYAAQIRAKPTPVLYSHNKTGGFVSGPLELLAVNADLLRERFASSMFRLRLNTALDVLFSPFKHANRHTVGYRADNKTEGFAIDQAADTDLASKTRLAAAELQNSVPRTRASLPRTCSRSRRLDRRSTQLSVVTRPKRVFISSQRQLLHLLGVITSPMALLTYGFAFLNLPREMQKATALVPALQSNWLMMHVTIMILSYAALLCGSIFSMVFLLLTSLNTSSPSLQTVDKSGAGVPHHNEVTHHNDNEVTEDLPERSSGKPIIGSVYQSKGQPPGLLTKPKALKGCPPPCSNTYSYAQNLRERFALTKPNVRLRRSHRQSTLRVDSPGRVPKPSTNHELALRYRELVLGLSYRWFGQVLFARSSSKTGFVQADSTLSRPDLAFSNRVGNQSHNKTGGFVSGSLSKMRLTSQNLVERSRNRNRNQPSDNQPSDNQPSVGYGYGYGNLVSRKANFTSQSQSLTACTKPQVLFAYLEKETEYLSLAERLDNYSYRVLALGFPLLTVGILSGAVWANEAWGSYWSWDPKETWALITWLVFAIYLHARILKGWTGRKPAIIATFGFFVVWFCYLGVNLLGTGLHSYGWFSN